MISRNATLQDACDYVCRLLPQGWTVEIVLAKDSGYVELIGPDDESMDCPSNQENILDSLNDAVAHALQAANEP